MTTTTTKTTTNNNPHDIHDNNTPESTTRESKKSTSNKNENEVNSKELKLKIPKNAGIASGISNLGNTCYMNAILQALSHSQELLQLLSIENEGHFSNCAIAKENLNLESKKYCICCEFEKHIEKVHNSGDIASPADFIHGFMKYIAPQFKIGLQEDSHEFLRLLIDAMQKSNDDSTYPYYLFRGMIESTVICKSCNHISKTIDPMEDLGLEVFSSKTNTIKNSLDYYTSTENLDGYKCNNCNHAVHATKQVKLCEVPPILTLHLKRFRYNNGNTNGIRSSRVNGNNTNIITGSAKIEGHVKFEQFFDMIPYTTPTFQNKFKKMYCRLFAVVVHNGRNSHSGHYLTYVRNLQKNEWWKMDDTKVTSVGPAEVFDSHAYILFYRVVDHPILVDLKEKDRIRLAKEEEEDKLIQNIPKIEKNVKNNDKPKNNKPKNDTKQTTSDTKKRKSNKTNKSYKFTKINKGEDWIKKQISTNPENKLNIDNNILPYINKAQDTLSEMIQFKSNYFQFIKKEASDEIYKSKNGNYTGPSIVSELDVLLNSKSDGNTCDLLRDVILQLLYYLLEESSKPNIEDNDTAKDNFEMKEKDDEITSVEKKNDCKEQKDENDNNETANKKIKTDHESNGSSIAQDSNNSNMNDNALLKNESSEDIQPRASTTTTTAIDEESKENNDIPQSKEKEKDDCNNLESNIVYENNSTSTNDKNETTNGDTNTANNDVEITQDNEKQEHAIDNPKNDEMNYFDPINSTDNHKIDTFTNEEVVTNTDYTTTTIPDTTQNSNICEYDNIQNCTTIMNNEITIPNDKISPSNTISTNNLDDFKFNENDLDEIVNYNIMEISETLL